MNTGVRLDFDVRKFEESLAKHERDLYARATRRPSDKADRKRPDETAAIELLLKFARFGKLSDPGVQEAILEGMRDVAAHVANSSMLQKQGEAPQVHPLMFFLGTSEPGKRGRKAAVGRRLALAAAYGDRTSPNSMPDAPLLTEEELRAVLTTRKGKVQARAEWPRKIHRVESLLIDFVQRSHFGASEDEARWYVRCSFELPWDKPDEDFNYPGHWK
jgi:hypothetical protein